MQLEHSNARPNVWNQTSSLFSKNSLTNSNKYLEYRYFYYFIWNFLFISTYDELGSMGVDFGRLLENQAKMDEKSSQPPSAPVSRSNSRTASITSLSSFLTNETSKEEPDEVILIYSLKFYETWLLKYLVWQIWFRITLNVLSYNKNISLNALSFLS